MEAGLPRALTPSGPPPSPQPVPGQEQVTGKQGQQAWSQQLRTLHHPGIKQPCLVFQARREGSLCLLRSRIFSLPSSRDVVSTVLHSFCSSVLPEYGL